MIRSFSHLLLWLQQATRLSGFLVAALTIGITQARPLPAPGNPAPSLSTILRANGTVRPGVKGSFNAAGYSLHTGPHGEPVFQPAAARGATGAAGVTGAGDVGWSSDFAVNGTNDIVYAIVTDGSGTLYIGGDFTTVAGIAAKGVAKWNGTRWSALTTGYAGMTQVRTLALDSRGILYAGGYFQYAGVGVTANSIAKWNGHFWSPLGGGLEGFVFALAVDSNDNLYVGGKFSHAVAANGNVIATPTGVAKWNGSAWAPMGQGDTSVPDYGYYPAVNALLVDGNTLYAGGTFTKFDGMVTSGIVKWEGSKWVALGTGVHGSVSALSLDSNRNLYVGGNFDQAGGKPANNIASWDGSKWAALGTGMDGTVNALAFGSNGELYAGGSFLSAGGTQFRRLARWNGMNWKGQDLVLSGDTTNQSKDVVNALTFDKGGNLYVAGDFIRAGGVPASNVAKLGFAAKQWSALGALPVAQGFNNSAVIYSVVLDGRGNLYAGGRFTTVAHKAVNNIARWNGTYWSAMGAGLNDQVGSLAVDSQGNLYASGYFTESNGLPLQHVARWNGSKWAALGTGLNGSLSRLVIDSKDNLYAGDFLANNGGPFLPYVVKWNGMAWVAVGTNLPTYISALVVDGSGTLYVAGGNVHGKGGYVYEWRNSSWVSLAKNIEGVYSGVMALAVDVNNNLYAGGDFYTIEGVAANSFAKWNGTAWTALGSGPPRYDAFDQVNALTFDDKGGLYAGGTSFPNYGTLPSPMGGLAKWNGTTWTALGTGILGGVNALAWDGKSLYVGGSFDYVSDSSKVMLRLGHFTPPPPPTLVSISPDISARGSIITLNGTNLASSTITFNGLGAPSVNHGYVVNAAGTQITGLVVPYNAVSGPISVTTTGGTSNSLPFKIPPTLTRVNPEFTGVGYSITLYGDNLTGTTIRFTGKNNNTVSTGFTVNAEGTMIYNIVVPAGAKTGPVSVSNASATSNGLNITVDRKPTITGLTPARGPVGTLVTITGSDLLNKDIRFNYYIASVFKIKNDSIVVVEVPTGATTGLVTANGSNGFNDYSNGLLFTVLKPPTLAALSPSSGPIGTSMMLTGTNLTGASQVTFTGSSANSVTSGFTVNATGTQITGLVVPPGATTGPVTLTTPDGTSAGLMFTLLRATAAVGAAPASHFGLHPNPAHTTALLELPPGLTGNLPFVLFDLLGREVRRYVVPAGATEATLDLSGVPVGLYELRGAGGSQRLAIE